MTIYELVEAEWFPFVIGAAVIIGAFILARVSRWLIEKAYTSASKKIKTDPTRYKFLKNATSLVIWMLAIATLVLLVPRLKALAITLFAGAGIMVAIIGLAAQQAFSNIISGIFIVMFKPFRVGDLIQVGSRSYGVVEDINLRHTVLLSFESKRIIIPNSVISSETILNDSIEDIKICKWVDIGISYDSDVELATRIIQEEATRHAKCIDNRTAEQVAEGVPQVVVRLASFGDFSVNLRALIWTDDPFYAMQMQADINKSVKKRFDEEGVEIPFPYRTVVYKKDLPANKRLNDE